MSQFFEGLHDSYEFLIVDLIVSLSQEILLGVERNWLQDALTIMLQYHYCPYEV